MGLQVQISAIYEVQDCDSLRTALRDSGHRLFRLPEPKKRGLVASLERNETRDQLPVVLAVPRHMADLKEVAMLLQCWCSTPDDVNGYLLVLEVNSRQTFPTVCTGGLY
jgi:hypothetical protein